MISRLICLMLGVSLNVGMADLGWADTGHSRFSQVFHPVLFHIAGIMAVSPKHVFFRFDRKFIYDKGPIEMSNIHFIGGEKGGVGKSLVARVLAQYFIDKNLPFLGFDTDKSHGALLRFYADFSAPIVLDRHDSLDPIIEQAFADPQRRILVDLAAQTQQSIAAWLEDSGVLDFAEEHGITLTWWHVMDSGRDSVDLLRRWLDQFGGRLKLVLVLNEVRGDRFEILDASGERERAEKFGASVISLRRLPDTTIQKIDQQSASFWAALNHSDRANAGLGLLERQRVKVWLHRAYSDIGKIVL